MKPSLPEIIEIALLCLMLSEVARPKGSAQHRKNTAQKA